MRGSATYSPEDNKLRFYPASRLPREQYDQIKAAGFIWAPKQELFVAPMWTPDREDLLIDWCGEIGDEDKSLVSRAEERADRFKDYSASRLDDANAARESVSAIADHIPLGQPILVGHHSEKHARRDAERIENGMRQAVKMWETSNYWKQRAAGAIHHAKYKERPDVRARRIKKIEAEQRKSQRSRAESIAKLAAWGNVESHEQAYRLACGDGGWLPVVKQENAGTSYESWWHAYDVLRPDEERYKACPSVPWEQVKARAAEVYPRNIAHAERWIAHYENRLAYERAMLAADGGTVADQKKPEQGGAIRCWVKSGKWIEVMKVNKVSVTVLDNWGNGGRDFTRTIKLEEIKGVMSKAEWEATKGAGPTEAEVLRKFNQAFDAEHLAELDAASYGRKFADLGEYDRCKVRNAVRVKLGIALPEGGAKLPEPPPKPASTYTPPARTVFDDMKDSLRTGVQVTTVDQLFPTPKELAQRVIELADIQPKHRILEPSAGTGALLLAIHEATPLSQWNTLDLVAVEVNPKLAKRLDQYTEAIHCADFLTCNGNLGTFDRIVMNPPFANGQDIKHIEHARHFLKPGGRLVAICANGPRQQEALKPIASEWHDLEPGTFASEGTNVNTALLIIEA